MDNAKKYMFRRLICLFSIMIVLFCLAGSVSDSFSPVEGYDIGRIEINIKSTDGDEAGRILVKHAKELSYQLHGSSVSYISEIDSYAGTGGKTFAVKAVLSDSSYLQFSPVHIVRGAYFNQYACMYGMNTAVVSTKFAKDIYNSYDVIGSHFELLGQKYIITGLYEDREPLLSLIASDGVGRIYIPFESCEKHDTMPLKALFIAGEGIEEDTSRIYNLTSILGEYLNVPSEFYKMTDYYEVFHSVSQPVSLFVFVVGILSIILLAGVLFKYIKWGWYSLKKDLGEKYLLDVLKANIMKICAFFIGTAAIAAGATVIFFIVRFRLYLPASIIPQENIFDLNFYMDKIKEAIYMSNQSSGYSPTSLEAYASKAASINIVFAFFMLLVFIAIISSIKLNALLQGGRAIPVRSLIISLPAGLIVSFVLAGLFHLQYVIPLKEIFILMLYSLLYIFLKSRKAHSKI
jgi:hypothetical protein